MFKDSEYHLNEELWENYQRLTPVQQKVLTLLITGENINQIATKCNIERSTIYRWLQIDLFVHCLKLWQKNILVETDLIVKKIVDKGLEKLDFVLENPTRFESKDYLKAIELSLGLMGLKN